jgi:hypothetical protein
MYVPVKPCLSMLQKFSKPLVWHLYYVHNFHTLTVSTADREQAKRLSLPLQPGKPPEVLVV